MKRLILCVIAALLLCPFLRAQDEDDVAYLKKKKRTVISGSAPITLDATCTGNPSSANPGTCSSAMTVSSGDTITVECATNGSSFDPSNIIVNDPVNGFYKNINIQPHPNSANVQVAYSIFFNSAGGSITPQCQNWEANGWVISAQAWKNTRTTFGLDGGGVNLFKSVTTASANPTAGTAAAPTGNNEAVVCQLVLPASQTTSSGSGFSPAGTLTGVVNTYAQYFEYDIQTTATAVNCPYTSASAKWTDGQFAILPSSASSSYDAVTGSYLPAAAQTNGASATIAILNNNTTGSLNTLAPPTASTWWSLGAGSAVTFDTSVSPIGSYKLLMAGKAHTIGDAATSIKVPSANVTTSYVWAQEGPTNLGNGEWMGGFIRLGSNQAASQGCDTFNLDSTLVEGALTLQMQTDSSNVIRFDLEINGAATPTSTAFYPSTALNFGQDYYVIVHVAGVDEANDEIYVLGESTPGTLPWTQFGHFTWPRSGPVISTPTATASNNASTITVSSATGIVIGQTVWSGTTSTLTNQLTPGTVVTSVSGTTIGISPNTAASMSATPVIFAGNVAETTGSVTAGSTTLTVTSGTGLVAGASGTGQVVGMTGVQAGTWLASGSGTSWTLSQPATTTENSIPVYLWTPQTQAYGFHFGKFSSCSNAGDTWFSGILFDPYGEVLPLIANGTNNL